KIFSEVYDKELADLHLSKLDECLEKQKLVNYNFGHNQDGQFQYFEARFVPFMKDKALRFVRDFTEEYLKDLQIRKLSLAIDQSPVTVVITNLSGDIEYVNPAFLEVTGYSLEEVIGKNPRILQSGSTDKRVYEDLWNTIIAGDKWTGELLNKKKNGDLFYESVSISPLHDQDGRLLSYLAVKQDITHKKKIEEEIRELNANLEKKIRERTAELAEINTSLVNEINFRVKVEGALNEKTTELENFFSVALDLLCIADMTGHFLKLNKAWESILGYTIDDLENKLFLEFVHPDDLQPTLDAMAQLSMDNPILRFTNRYRTREGKYKHIEWHSVPVGDKIYAAARDVTERKRTEEFEIELLQLSTKLTGIPVSEIPSALAMALEKIGQFMEADRAVIFEINDTAGTMSMTYEWYSEGVSSQMSVARDVDISTMPMWFRTLRDHKNVIINDVFALCDEWIAEREALMPIGNMSYLAIPMFVGNNLIGYSGLVKKEETKCYTDAELNILSIWNSLLTSLINNKETGALLENMRVNFETFFNTIDDFLWVVDMQGRIIHTNKTAVDRLGYTEEEFYYKPVIEVHKGDREEEARGFINGMLKGTVDTCTVPLTAREGKLIPVETRVKRGLWNGTQAIFGVSKDISNVQLSEQKFSMAFRYSSAMMAISELDSGKYVDVNNAFMEVLGYEKDELIGRTNVELGLFTDPGLRTRIAEGLTRGEVVRDLEIEIKRKDDTYRAGLLSADVIFIGDRKCMLTVTSDITERKKVEEEIRKARTEAEQANRTKSDFLANMSHEIRTPMNAILGYSELLASLVKEQTQKDYLESIKSSGRTLLTLINDILDLSKIEAGKLELEMDFIETVTFFQEFERIFAFKTNEKGLNFITEVSSGTPAFVYIDGVRLRQVILNLVGNAVKFTNKGSITLSVFSENRKEVKYPDGKSEEMVDLVIEVSDTGIGIPEDYLGEIFGSFIQVKTKMSQGGTGLGLAISRKLVQLMDGDITVRSKQGVGSTFTVRISGIPFLSSYQSTRAVFSIDPNLVEFEKATILVVDDVDENRKFIRDVIKNTNLEVFEAASGFSALELLKTVVPDLIITDIRMPGMDGFELLDEIKSIKKLEHIPVVAYSASVMKDQRERIHTSKFAGLLIKPVRIAELYVELTNNLRYTILDNGSHGNGLAEKDYTEDIINKEEMMKSLEGPLCEKWKGFEVRQPLGEIKDFSKAVRDLGEKHNCKSVKDFGNELHEAAVSFNIEKVLKLIKRYGDIVKNLK
ncbi:MAG: PAS domain S-box protein, partial [Bacteroidales bacterium]